MANKDKVICVFGGSGFLGRHIVQNLARQGYRIKVATRYPESAYELKTYGDVGQIVPTACHYKNEDSIREAMEGAHIVINLVGVLFEKGRNNFMSVHCDLPKIIGLKANELGISKLIHLSALGVDTSQSKYAKSKLAGENALLEVYPQAVILRPSVVFGAGDNFFNMFAKMASFLPVLPLIGGGHTKFQPVYVEDIAEAVTNIVSDNIAETDNPIYELAGPEIVSFKEIYEILLEHINRDRMLVPLPWAVAKMQGMVLGLMPKPLLTLDQVRSLKFDNIKDEQSAGLKELGVTPTAMGVILPRYLSNFKRGGRFANKKQA